MESKYLCWSPTPYFIHHYVQETRHRSVTVQISVSQSGLYRPPGVYENLQGVYDSVKKFWGSMIHMDPNVDSSL